MKGIGWALVSLNTGLTGTITLENGAKVAAVFLSKDEAIKIRDSSAKDMVVMPVELSLAKGGEFK